MAVVRSAFKPEFLNRLDDVVFFGSLGADELASIVDIQIGAAGQAAGGPPADPRRHRRRLGNGWRSAGSTRSTVPARCAG